MSATTIKIEDPLLSEIRKAKREGQSVSSYVKEAIEHEIRRRQMAEAAHQYQALMKKDAEETHSMDEWESAPLTQPPRAKRR
jgi:predicted CopG family antitoxin